MRKIKKSREKEKNKENKMAKTRRKHKLTVSPRISGHKKNLPGL